MKFLKILWDRISIVEVQARADTNPSPSSADLLPEAVSSSCPLSLLRQKKELARIS